MLVYLSCRDDGEHEYPIKLSGSDAHSRNYGSDWTIMKDSDDG